MDNNKRIFQRSKNSIPGGVNSPARAFNSVGGTPLVIREAKGAYMIDENGTKYIDLINSWGPMILGHAFEPVRIALEKQLLKSFSYGTPTEIEMEMAEMVVKMVPNIDMVRMVSSGTEACFAAIRLARGYTSKNKIIKFIGNYHGHADSFLKKAGSGVASLSIQNVPGVPAETLKNTLLANYNDLVSVRSAFERYPGDIACVIVEPVAGNMGCIPPDEGFLHGLKQLCEEYNSVLIFDEVMTGFRLAPGGAQERLNEVADMVTFGKVIGAGLPVGAFAARKEIMEHIAPLGSVYQAGTLSGNPLAMTAGYTQLKHLYDHQEIYTSLDQTTKQLKDGIQQILLEKGIEHRINRIGSMISLFFIDKSVQNFDDAQAANHDLFSKFFHHMLKFGVYLPPSGYETWFISHAIQDAELDQIFEGVRAFQA